MSFSLMRASVLLCVSPLLLTLHLMSCQPSAHEASRPLRVALPGQPTSLDPNIASDAVSGLILTQLHEGLTRHNAALEVEPALASAWRFNEDYTQLTYTLRDDIKWSDGRAITSKDLIYSWRRLLDPKTAAEYAYFLYDIKGAQDYNTGKGSAQALGLRAPDARTLVVELNRPAPYFPHISSFMVTYPVPEHVISARGDDWTRPEHIVGSGPFVIKSIAQDYKMVLEPNPHYTLQPVRIKRVELYQIAEKSTALNLFVSDRLDVVLELLPLAIPKLQQDKDPSYYNGPKLEVRYVAYRSDRPPLNDLNLRKALTMAIDRRQLPRVLRGGELATTSWLPPGMFGHNPSLGLGYQPEQARALLAQAGFPKGEGMPKLTLLFRSGDDWRLIAENLQQQWARELSIEVDIQVRDQKVFFREIDDKQAPPTMHLARWIADFPDPENFMNLFTSTSGNNSLGFAQADYDALVDKAVRTDDRATRKQLYDQAQTVLLERDAAIAPLYVNALNALKTPALKGLEFNAMGDLFLAPTYWQQDDQGVAP